MPAPQLKFNCPEKWDNMSPSGEGRYCGKCARVITDFSGMSNAEITETLSRPVEGEICGSFKASQLHKPFNDRRDRLIGFYQRIFFLPGKAKLKRTILLGLAGILLILTGCHRRMSGYVPDKKQMSKQIRKEQKIHRKPAKKSS